MDLIDREQLMNYIRSRKINIGKLAHDVIMKQPSIQPQESKWISVSERLPDKNMPCLVSVGELYLTQIAVYSDLMGTIDHKIFYQGDYGSDNFENITKYVNAWMPLPKHPIWQKVR